MPIHSGPHNTSSFKLGLWWKIIVSIVLFVTLGFFSAYYSMQTGKEWYYALNHPFFAPTKEVTRYMWILVYVLMGASFGIIWQIKSINRYPNITKYAKRGMLFFGAHLLLNLIYPTLLFELQMPWLALVDIVSLAVFIMFLIRHFFRLDRVSAFLLIPYLLWIIYATALNIAMVILN